MQLQSQRAVQLFRRTRDFLLRTQPEVALGDLQVHVANLGAAADHLAAHAIEQDTRSRQGQAGTATLRRLVRTLKLEYIRPIALTGRALFRDDPAVFTALRSPGRTRRPEALVAAAQAMANTAMQHTARFEAAGFPADFAERLRAAATRVADAVDQRAGDMARRAAATAAVRHEMSRGRAIMALLDAMVAPRFEGEPEMAAEWRSLMRQGRARTRGDVVEFPSAGAGIVTPSAPVTPATPWTTGEGSSAAAGRASRAA